jgi:regulation of enolase protein 1 (concanavalin A-like superfamily)
MRVPGRLRGKKTDCSRGEEDMKWYNEPSSWHQEGERLLVKSDPKTDFWRKTHDGGIRDSGHFYHRVIGSHFTAEVI